MVKVIDGLWIGDESSCRSGSAEMAVVHACKSPCHQRAVNYSGSLQASHQYYLSLETKYDLFLNIIDPPVPLFKLETFSCYLRFAETQSSQDRALLVHCNKGESRAPSLALLHLAKNLPVIPATSFREAASEFRKLYPPYAPGLGIQTFLTDKWASIGTS